MLLELDRVTAGYGPSIVLRDVTLEIDNGEIVALIGRNGSGRSTLLRTVLGFTHVFAGRIVLDGEEITDLPTFEAAARGLRYIPEHRGIFPTLTVGENMKIGYLANKGKPTILPDGLRNLPILSERAGQRAGSLSGGERQQLALARAFVSAPRLLLIDELSEGLQPNLVSQLVPVLKEFADQGIAILLAEQNIELCLRICNRAYLFEKGTIVDSDRTETLMRQPERVYKYVTL